MQRLSLPKWATAALALAGAAILLLVDLETPIGLAIPFLYIVLAPVVVMLRSVPALIVSVLAVAGMSGLGLWVSATDGGPFATGSYSFDEFVRDTVINRMIAVSLFVAVLILLVRIQSAQDELHRLSTTDPLTGALNRRRFGELAEIERRRAERSGAPMSILMLDIDHFKLVNDQYGHAAGDAAIRELARNCHATLRPGDLFGRWGGEEFVIALPETSLTGALKTAERLREILSKTKFDANGKQRSITVSIGVAGLMRDELAVDHAINRADRALYRAKEGGRNRVEVEGPLTP
jgi:diguanylate cyclase (GGDEF)-like protein